MTEPARRKTRVMVVDDSILSRHVMIKGLSEDPDIVVVGFAVSAADAQQKIDQLNPDVMTCDVQMPGMNGIDFLKQLLPTHPLPVVLVSSLNLKVFDALAAGAVDFVQKPVDAKSKDDFIQALTHKVTVAAAANVRRSRLKSPPEDVSARQTLGGTASDRLIVGIGASTGGTEAALEVLRRLPGDSPGTVVVQHMPPGFTKMYAERLHKICRMEVREAKDGDLIKRGVALVAPADFQCRVIRVGPNEYRVACRPGEKVSGHRPSVDVLFSSMAEQITGPMVGIIMTGMGRDGAEGLLKMRKRGAFTIGQDRESSVVYGMPAAAYEMGAVCRQASCDHIAELLLEHIKSL